MMDKLGSITPGSLLNALKNAIRALSFFLIVVENNHNLSSINHLHPKILTSFGLTRELLVPFPMSVDPGAQVIVIDEDVDNELHSDALWERLQDPSLGEGTITLIIRDPNITIIGDMNIDWGDRREAPLYVCKFLLRYISVLRHLSLK